MVENYVFCKEVHFAKEYDDISWVNKKDKGEKEDFPGRHFAHIDFFLKEILQQRNYEGTVKHNLLIFNLQMFMKIVG